MAYFLETAIQALCELGVPVITIHTRKAYGMAVSTTSNPENLGLRLAWPTAEWGDMPVEGGAEAAFLVCGDLLPPTALERDAHAGMKRGKFRAILRAEGHHHRGHKVHDLAVGDQQGTRGGIDGHDDSVHRKRLRRQR